ncbi:hypothetical protein IVB55_32880 [Bradyrhizobium sp. CW4]|uniref:vanadium-dependent haloperoxidase n=1 Tax=Bradyrhizobium sp. CW4 TaxID=2782687 RepID=UPI001FF782AF|nr:vanadium-dependent haloperoxidase [Bradyrhizobium sp. CW4]MCK1417652.1 hypothetical protein [Bradyrhizobium sp. CW4]
MTQINRRGLLAAGAFIGGTTLSKAQPLVVESLPTSSASQEDLARQPVAFWNEVGIDLLALDHSIPITNPTLPADKLPVRAVGPCASARAIGVLQLVVADAVKSSYPNVRYNAFLKDDADKSVEAPALYVGGAAAAILQYMFRTPAHAFLIDRAREAYLRYHGREDLSDWAKGWKFGSQKVFRDLYAWTDIWERIRPNAANYTPPARGHNVDPYNCQQGFYGQTWGAQPPLVLTTAETTGACAPPAPPREGTPDYERDLAEVRVLGSLKGSPQDPRRTIDQERVGVFWAYDGARLLGTPPRFYNQILRKIAAADRMSVQQQARMFALCNLAMADAGIVAWGAKFNHKVWRPVLGIQQHATAPDANWKPLGAPKTNREDFALGTADVAITAQGLLGGASIATNVTAADKCKSDPAYAAAAFTPNFPAYPSGHATFGTACFDMLRRVRAETAKRPKEADAIDLRITSDELNGVTVDNFKDDTRPLRPVRFDSIEDLIEANKASRVHLGVHWKFDAEGGDAAGRKIADTIYARAYLP